jgi:hypothetical protein
MQGYIIEQQERETEKRWIKNIEQDLKTMQVRTCQ